MEIIRVEDADLREIERRCRTFRAIETLTAEVILSDIQTHQRRRVIVLCNTVSQAQGLFQDLELTCITQSGITVTLLHSRFLPSDRAQKEAELKATFAQNWQRADSQCHVLISTQVIEAGMNITCEVMHTHLCPMNSLLQRAGRCARFQDESGEVYVYRSIQVASTRRELASDLDEVEAPSAKKQFLPYRDETCELTWQVLQEHTSEQVNQNVGFRTEERWINQVHQQEDQLQQQRRINNKMNFEQRFEDAFFRGDQSAATELIRFVDSRSLFVWQGGAYIDFEEEIDPKQLVPFSVPVSTLCKVWREFKELGYETDWIFKRIEAPTKTETYFQPICTPITSRGMLVTSIRILVNPHYVYYDDKIGLLLGHVDGNRFTSPAIKQAIANEYQYRMDTYIGHLVLMWKCWREPFRTTRLKNGHPVEITYASVRAEMLQAGGRFLQAKFPQVVAAEALFEVLVFFAIFCHDLGKLQVKWQSAMRGWQTVAYSKFQHHPRSHPQDYLLAHTDYDPSDPAQKAELKQYEQKHKRPNHAIESAFLAWEILNQSLYPLLEDIFDADAEAIENVQHVIIMATGRHHSAWAKGWQPSDLVNLKQIELHPAARKAIAQTWRNLTRFLPKTLPLQPPNLSQDIYPTETLDLNLFGTDQLEYQQLYTLVVRALRLCDQRSVQVERLEPTVINTSPR